MSGWKTRCPPQLKQALFSLCTLLGSEPQHPEAEQSLQLQLGELERRLREEEVQRREAHQAQRQQHLLTQQEEEERRRLRREEFHKELMKIEEETLVCLKRTCHLFLCLVVFVCVFVLQVHLF